ncbi:DUF3244 domain-containing protein [Dyadobacter sp. 32]|uniref:DUF3244 domain-containing protein n=1 Tax=Dyadobacter sp. 32 TaxID=538966 RepID=UPI0011EF2DFE
MKNSIKTFVCALAMVTTVFTANAEDKETKKPLGFEAGIHPDKNGKINVMVNKLSSNEATLLLIKNAQGEVVYRETINKTTQKFRRILDLHQLESGKYELEISSNGEKQSKAIQISEPITERLLTIK